MRRGEIWWAELPIPEGSEPGYNRPVLIVQADSFNRSTIKTILVVIITKNLVLRGAPGNVFLPINESKLGTDSVINVSQVITLDKNFLYEKTGMVSSKLMSQVEKGLKTVLALK